MYYATFKYVNFLIHNKDFKNFKCLENNIEISMIFLVI